MFSVNRVGDNADQYLKGWIKPMADKVRVNGAQWADNWGASVATDSEKVAQGIRNVSESPGKKAAANADGWLAGCNRSKPKYIAGNLAYSKEEWEDRAINVGIPRRQEAVESGKAKVSRYAEKAIPVYNDIMGRMPGRKATVRENCQRTIFVAEELQKASLAGKLRP